MRKLYWRRFFLPSFVLSILSVFCLIITTIVHSKNRSIDMPIYTSQTNSLLQSFSIPANYLVIPYREFALRTSIACRTFKLDNPRKTLTKFYPQYSEYLRGSFPYIIPYGNITFDDVENFYTKILPNKKKTDRILQTSFAKNISFENIPYEFLDGLWHPIGVTSAQRTAILVPLQGREYNAKAFLLNMHAFLRRQQLTYTIILIEQISPVASQFNKGRLFNTAIDHLQKQKLNITCLILHDVDLIPENDGNLYTCETKYPKHTTSRVRPLDSKRGYIRYYEFLIGGVLLLPFDMYKTLNGFSNLYWGWGGEDDDLALRLIQRRMCIVRPNYELAIYIGLPHPRGKRNDARFDLLTWSTVRLDTDGFAQIGPLTRIVSSHETSVVTHLKVDVNIDGKLYTSLSTSSSLSTRHAQESLTSKMKARHMVASK